MPDQPGDSPEVAEGYDSLDWQPEQGSQDQTVPDAEGTATEQATPEGEEAGAGEPAGGEAPQGDELAQLQQRLSEAQSEFHRRSEENAELKGKVDQLTTLLQNVVTQGSGQRPQENGVSDKDLTAYTERIAQEKGVGPAIREVAAMVAQRMVEPAYQKISELETRIATPEYNKLENKINGYLQKVQSGELNINQMLVKLAKLETDAESNPKPPSRPADNPTRGAGTGNTSSGQPAESGSPLTPGAISEMGSAESMARAMLKRNLPQSVRSMLYRNHPNLRPKG